MLVLFCMMSQKIAGLIHVMLPDSSLGRAESINVAKFADSGIAAMIDLLKLEGVQKFKLKAKIAGVRRCSNLLLTKIQCVLVPAM